VVVFQMPTLIISCYITSAVETASLYESSGVYNTRSGLLRTERAFKSRTWWNKAHLEETSDLQAYQVFVGKRHP
jgi:hypothetical protein